MSDELALSAVWAIWFRHILSVELYDSLHVYRQRVEIG